MSNENTTYTLYLLELSQAGRQRAFIELCEINLRNVYTVIYRLLGDYESARQVTIRTFLKAWDEIKDFEIRNSFVVWLKNIAVRAAISELRKKPTEISKDSKIKYTKSEAKYLESLIKTLPTRERVIFVLHDIEGYPYEEINYFFNDLIVDEIKTKLIETREFLMNNLEL